MTSIPATAFEPPRPPAPIASPVRLVLWLVWGVALVLGAWGIYQRITQGHLPAGYGSYVPWGLWVAIYFHGVGIAGGAFVLGAGGFVLDLPGFRHPATLRTVIVLAVAAIIPAFMGVWLDLGHMERASYIFLSPSFTSMMAFNAWMYNAFVIIAAICWLLSFRTRSGWLKPLLCLAIMFSVLFPSQSGAFFGVVEAKGFWHSALLPMLFLASAITAGAATLLAVRFILGQRMESAAAHEAALARLRLVTLLGLIVYFVFEFAEFSIALWNPNVHAPAIELILWGPYWWVFWIVHLLLGGAIPLALLITRRHGAWTVAALLVAATFISARLNVLVPGQAVGELKGLQEAFQHDRLTYIYHATAMEYLVGLFLLAVGMAAFYVGERINVLVANRTARKL
ncbi:MAG: NrfD/PsrC family molybdoenzyme membrane anchor subunit [Phycisphaeraceae bacterium]